MPEIDLGDFSKVGVLPPEGYYRLIVTKPVPVKQNNAKDGSNLVFQFGLADLPDGVDEAFSDFEFTQWASFKPKARPFFKAMMTAITQDEERWASDQVKIVTDDDDVCTDPDFEDMTVMALLRHGKDQNGSPQMQVAKYFPDDGEVTPEVASEE